GFRAMSMAREFEVANMILVGAVVGAQFLGVLKELFLEIILPEAEIRQQQILSLDQRHHGPFIEDGPLVKLVHPVAGALNQCSRFVKVHSIWLNRIPSAS